ncbi:MAG: gamma-glutamyl-gamma-aminobutyrate hydrolase family protein [Acidobacteriota bacterium]
MSSSPAKRPVIAVAWPQPDYLSALEQAGAEALILTPEENPLPEALQRADGVLLTGGADVDPMHYGHDERHPTLSLEPARDAYELAIARTALAKDLPLLGICRGAQLLNVAAGGTLFQDLPSQHTSTLGHARRESPDLRAHDLHVQPNTCLSTLLTPADKKPEPLLVNSRHHQAVRDVAPGFIVSAEAPDGVIEAIERPGAHFCLGVQWHPENFWRTGEFSSLFDGLVRAARENQGQRTS